jgi:hypothetical protein
MSACFAKGEKVIQAREREPVRPAKGKQCLKAKGIPKWTAEVGVKQMNEVYVAMLRLGHVHRVTIVAIAINVMPAFA